MTTVVSPIAASGAFPAAQDAGAVVTYDTVADAVSAIATLKLGWSVRCRGRTVAGDPGAGDFNVVDSEGLVADGGTTFVSGSKALVRHQHSVGDVVPAEWFGYPITRASLVGALEYANGLGAGALDDSAQYDHVYATGRRLRWVSISSASDPIATITIRFMLGGICAARSGFAPTDIAARLTFARGSGPGFVLYTGESWENFVVSRLPLRGVTLYRHPSGDLGADDHGIVVDGVPWFGGTDLESVWIYGHRHGFAFGDTYRANITYAGYVRMRNVRISGCAEWGVYAEGVQLNISEIDGDIIQNGSGGVWCGADTGTTVTGDREGQPIGNRVTLVGARFPETYFEGFGSGSPHVVENSDLFELAPQTGIEFYRASAYTVDDSREGVIRDHLPALLRGATDCTSHAGLRIPTAAEGLALVANDTQRDAALVRLGRVPGTSQFTRYSTGFTDTVLLGQTYVAGYYCGESSDPIVFDIPFAASAGRSVVVAFSVQRIDSPGVVRLSLSSGLSTSYTLVGTRTIGSRYETSQVIASATLSTDCDTIRLSIEPYTVGLLTGVTIGEISVWLVDSGITGIPQFSLEHVTAERGDWYLAQKQLLRYSPSLLWLPPRVAGLTHDEGLSAIYDLSGNGENGACVSVSRVASDVTPAYRVATGASSIADALSYSTRAKFTRSLVLRDRNAAPAGAIRNASGDTVTFGVDMYGGGIPGSSAVYCDASSYRIVPMPGPTAYQILTAVFDGEQIGLNRLRLYYGDNDYGGAVGGSFPATIPAAGGWTLANADVDLAARVDFDGWAPTGGELWSMHDLLRRVCGL